MLCARAHDAVSELAFLAALPACRGRLPGEFAHPWQLASSWPPEMRAVCWKLLEEHIFLSALMRSLLPSLPTWCYLWSERLGAAWDRRRVLAGAAGPGSPGRSVWAGRKEASELCLPCRDRVRAKAFCCSALFSPVDSGVWAVSAVPGDGFPQKQPCDACEDTTMCDIVCFFHIWKINLCVLFLL